MFLKIEDNGFFTPLDCQTNGDVGVGGNRVFDIYEYLTGGDNSF